MRISLQTAFPTDHSSDAYTDPMGIYASAVAEADARFNPANRGILQKLGDFSASHVLLPNAFPIDLADVPTPTATDIEVPAAKAAQIATISLFAAAGLRPLSYFSEWAGQLTVNLVPQPASGEDQMSFDKSIKELNGHTDAAYFPSPEEFDEGYRSYSCSPDFVALTCMRNPKQVPTKLAILSDILQYVSDEDQRELMRPFFIVRPQISFDLPLMSWRPGSVLWKNADGILCCRFSHSKVSVDKVLHPRAAIALQNFTKAIAKSFQELALNPGEILLFNNRTVIHGRGAIGGEWTPAARWLLRTYARCKSTPILIPNPAQPWCTA